MPEWKEEISRRLAGLSLSPEREADITDELAQHLEDRYQELISSGVTEAEARRTALEELSGSKVLAGELEHVERPLTHEPVILGTRKRQASLETRGETFAMACAYWRNPLVSRWSWS
jgi:hypothetical protein